MNERRYGETARSGEDALGGNRPTLSVASEPIVDFFYREGDEGWVSA